VGVERAMREADHSHPSSAEAKNVWICISTPPIRLYGAMKAYWGMHAFLASELD
jgi:hypothetical protein